MRSDLAKTITTALPAAGANVTGTPLDLEQPNGGALDNVAFEVNIPATPNLAEGKTLTVTILDGAASDSLATVDPPIVATITGGATGGEAAQILFRLPPTARRYVAARYAVEADGGNSTAVDATFRMTF